MRILKNIVITLALIVLAVLIGGIINSSHTPVSGRNGAITHVMNMMWIGTSIWASISSNRLEFRRYKSGLSYHPVTVFLVHVLLWIVVFPWFLTIRDNIKDGTAELKDEFKPEPVSTTYHQSSAMRTPPGPPVFGSLDTPQQITPSPVRGSMPPPLPPPIPKQSAPVPPPLTAAVPMPPPLRPVVPVPPPLPLAAPIPPPLPGPPPLPKPQPASINDRFEQLQKLAQLKEQGILTESEFQGEKQKILGQA